MKELLNTGESGGADLEDARWGLVRRISSSAHFQRSPRLREFLVYICDRALHNRLDEVTEQQIGCQVFGRRPDYNPGEDNIVRSQARQLRLKLQDYFATEGLSEPLILEIPKGSYVPVFHPRSVPEAEAAPQPPPQRSAWNRAVTFTLVAVALLALAVSLWTWQQDREFRRAAQAAREPLPFPWTALFDASHPTTIVSADSCLALLQDISRQRILLKDYLSPQYLTRLKAGAPAKDTAALMDLVAARQFTSFADLNIMARILSLSTRYGDRIAVRYARNLQIRDFKNGHFILLGSSRSNPWQELFEHARNFQCDFDDRHREPFYRNKSPRAGERAVYLTTGKDGRPGETFGAIVFLPNLEHSGNVLIIEGANMEGTEAAGEYITNPESARKLLASLGMAARGAQPRHFEVLLRTSAMAGTSRGTEPIAWRLGEEVKLTGQR